MKIVLYVLMAILAWGAQYLLVEYAFEDRGYLVVLTGTVAIVWANVFRAIHF